MSSATGADGVGKALTQFSRAVTQLHARPLWERNAGLGPGSPAAPAIWRYRDMRPQLMSATKLITEEQAERRVLMLENPGLPGTGFITNSLFAGLQIIMPGEIAASHRHVPNALRFVIEGEGAYTAVGGERVTMHPGDFIVTPGWAWHDHGHLGTEPVVWLDALDSPFVQFFGANFRENYAEETYPVAHREGDAASRYGANLLPVDDRPGGPASPLLRYPYDLSRAALAALARNDAADPVHGFRLRYANPATGGHAFPTMAVFLQLLPRGFAGAAYRSTAGTVFKIVEGSGSIRVDGEVFPFAVHDVLVVPPWCGHQLEAEDECVIFSYSDRAAQEKLGFWREERL